jgi:acetate kinase
VSGSPAVLVINAGSSSLRYQLVEPDTGSRSMTGYVERIGEPVSQVEHVHRGEATTRQLHLADHDAAMGLVLALCDELGPSLSDAGIVAVGHRVVMGADRYDGPVVIDPTVIATIEELAPLAPLHNPPNLAGIRAAGALLPDVPQVAVFDTAFFHALPASASTYALDRTVAHRFGIRRYGAHGTSHRFVSARARELLGRASDPVRQVVLHLGNGASAAAVLGGSPVETSMGFTPLEGLVMGTRTGDIDPSVVVHLLRHADMDVDQVDELLNRRSGMLGLCGHNDMREVHRLVAAGDETARLALEVYVHRLQKYIGAYAAALRGLDALTFTAGVGENDAVVRAQVVEGLEFLGLSVDAERNASPGGGARIISPEGSPVSVLVVPTDEELAIARDALAATGHGPAVPT